MSEEDQAELSKIMYEFGSEVSESENQSEIRVPIRNSNRFGEYEMSNIDEEDNEFFDNDDIERSFIPQKPNLTRGGGRR